MKEIITKELLSLVLGEEIVSIFKTSENEITYHIKDNFDGDGKQIEWKLNLDTLGRLCKELCTKQECALFSGWDYEKGAYNCLIGRHNVNEIIDNRSDESELEAIIKATEWVAKEKGLL